MSLFDFGYVSRNQTEVNESPWLWLPGVAAAFQVLIKGTGTLAFSSMALYENGTDVSATKLTGSGSISGRIIITKTLTGLVGGSSYRWFIYYTDDGVSQVREGTLIVPKLGVNPSTYPGVVNTLRVLESPITLYPGQSYSGQVTVDGQGQLTSLSMSAYKGIREVSTDVLSGSITSLQRVLTLKIISNLTAGTYLIYIFFTDAGQPTARYFEIIVPDLKAY